MTYSSGRTWRTLHLDQYKHWESHGNIATLLTMHDEMDMSFWLEQAKVEMNGFAWRP